MTKQDASEVHCRCCSRRDRSIQTARWLGLLFRMVYEIMKDNWPW